MEKHFDDKELGRIVIRHSARALRYTLKIADGRVVATMPARGSEKKMLALILGNREKIKEALKKYPARPPLDERTDWQTATFRIRIVRTDRDNFYMSLKEGVLQISTPQATDFADDEVQQLLKRMLASALRHEAKRCLPARLSAWAQKYGFAYRQVNINGSRTHWGSCTSGKHINLSLYLMLLPWHLIDYVLLHELCHLKEMSHNERFWGLLDQLTGGKAKALRAELKSHHIPR